MIEKIRSYIKEGQYNPEDGLDYWRERVFKSILLVIVIFGFFPYGLGMYMSFSQELYSVAVLDTFVYGALVYTIFAKRISLVRRVYFIVGLIFFVGISLTILTGKDGAGFNFVIGSIVMSSLLLGVKGAVNSLIATLGTILLIAWGLFVDLFEGLRITQYEAVEWIAVSVNVLAVGAMTSIPLAILLKGLESTIDAQSSLQQQLEDKIQQLKKAKNKAEEADVLKTNFLANMSHEVRTPLNSIMGFSELVLNKMYSSELERDQYMRTINQSGSYLLNIIENILDFSMIESNQLKYSLRPCNLNILLQELMDIYKHRKLITPDVIISSTHENKSVDTIVLTDAHRLKQVFINLINNALKFTEKGEVVIGFSDDEQGMVRCFVKDTGVGITPEVQSAIFDRFVKIEGLNQVKDGTGLGLSISKGIIEVLGGKMWLESEVNRGSIFYFTIPGK
ncbi:sensor histidine kinase [Saccharicrinis fermentans]|uniref:histidine kinase n=1 Tax=Saccharicrinis fermentans DSM 9555 = JCM 21142 TaxID=869213 RepID=W7YIY0_9BACT|nr:ATP-binding protein [Saccharicrinis fermentans]GAF04431.1 signal transduction histidine-protein kinase BarA [Saccharicrinis fermentans DSM 9555 = JCM 21142]